MWVKKFAKFTLSGTVFEIQAFLCFAIFAKNSKIQNGCHFWWDKDFVEIALSSMVVEIQAFLCFAIFAKNSKMATIFGGTKFF